MKKKLLLIKKSVLAQARDVNKSVNKISALLRIALGPCVALKNVETTTKNEKEKVYLFTFFISLFFISLSNTLIAYALLDTIYFKMIELNPLRGSCFLFFLLGGGGKKPNRLGLIRDSW